MQLPTKSPEWLLKVDSVEIILDSKFKLEGCGRREIFRHNDSSCLSWFDTGQMPDTHKNCSLTLPCNWTVERKSNEGLVN